MMTTLEVLIPTHTPEGISRVEEMNLPEIDGVGYVVSWQNYGDGVIPDALASRSDVKIVKYRRKGVSANRNNALDNATADILLIGDDDLIYTAGRLEAVRRVMDENPDVDYASFRYEGADEKVYPSGECDLGGRIPKYFSQTTFEIALRRNSPAGQLRFNEQFGPGAPVFSAAEDEIMFLTARARGIKMRFFPVTIACHPGLTTGCRGVDNDGILLSAGAVIAKTFPLTAALRIPLKAWRLFRSGKATFFKSLLLMSKGAIKGMRIRL
ncbi:MAG: glycosyltransferase [Duncaniella sp.]|nr:glycosyltransferase [Duncaniella sp.]